MSLAKAAPRGKKAQLQRTVQARPSLEEEIMSLNSLTPGVLTQLKPLFADSVADAASRVLGEGTGETLLRRIGDSRLRDPGAVYGCLDSYLGSGSEDVKRVIRQTFTKKVHNLYKITFEVTSKWKPY